MSDGVTKEACELTTKNILDKLDRILTSQDKLTAKILGNGKVGLSTQVLFIDTRLDNIEKFVNSQAKINESLVLLTAINATRYKIALSVFVIGVLTMIAQMIFKF